jgi:NADH-quinone oxidoreductase subunit C
MRAEELIKELEKISQGISMKAPETNRLIVNVEKEQVMPVLRFLKGEDYDHLALISCVDWMEEGEFELVYIISSYLKEDNERTGGERPGVILKSRISREEGRFYTVIPVFRNAEPYEREIHELFGINFEGHPRLTPLLLEREYDIPPFRKDFDTRKYVREVFGKIPFIGKKRDPHIESV